MANNTIRRSWNMYSMVNIEDLRGNAFQDEDGGHTFEITGLDASGNVAALSGTVAAVFLRADNTDVAISGSVSNGKVYVTLTDECYGYPGRFGLTIFLTSGGQKVAIYAAIGSVHRTSSGAVSPETSESVVDLINEIEAAIALIPSSYTDIMAAVAPTYSNTALYGVGAFAWYEGKLYRCKIPINTAESWNSAHWTLASIGTDVYNINRGLNFFGRSGEPVSGDIRAGWYLDSDGNIIKDDYAISGYHLSEIYIYGPTEIKYTGMAYGSIKSVAAYKKNGTVVPLLDGDTYTDEILTIRDPEVYKVAACSNVAGGYPLTFTCRSLMFEDAGDITYIARNLPLSTSSGFIDTGITYDFARPLYVRITNRSDTSAGYFESSLYQDDVAKQYFSSVKIPPCCSYTYEWFSVNAAGTDTWMGTNKYFTDYEWEVYINSISGVQATLDVFYYNDDEPLKKDQEARNVIYVDSMATSKGHGGAFKDICNAVAYAKSKVNVQTEAVTIFIRNGTYTLTPVDSRNGVIDKGANKISLIGEDRDKTVIVLNSTPAHNNKMVEHGGDSVIANITWKNLWTEDGSTIDYRHNSYCIHNDAQYPGGSSPYVTMVKNCYIYSEAFAPVGAGLHKNQTQVYEDCVVVFNSLDERDRGYNQWAPLYIHTPSAENDQDNCAVVINGCTCIAKKGTKAITLPFNASGSGTVTYETIPVTIQRTIGVTNGPTMTDVDSRYNLQPESALNNVDAWNYSHYHP